jgi:hypothetical protein
LAHGDGEEVDRELLNSVIEEQFDPAKHRVRVHFLCRIFFIIFNLHQS